VTTITYYQGDGTPGGFLYGTAIKQSLLTARPTPILIECRNGTE